MSNFETKPWLNDDPQNIEQYSEMVDASAPAGTIEISANGEYDVSEYATADVQVEGGSSDFSTATVTVNATGLIVSVSADPYWDDSTEDMAYNAVEVLSGNYLNMGGDVAEISSQGTVNFLYTKNYFYLHASSGGLTPTLSGNAEFATIEYGGETFQEIKVSGDCVVTFTDSEV